MTEEKKLTGYPSIDKLLLKYYRRLGGKSVQNQF